MKYYGELHRLGYKPRGLGNSPVASIPAACRNMLDFFFPYVLALISMILLLWFALPTAANPKDATILGVVSRISLTVASVVVSMFLFINFVQKLMNLYKGEHEPLDPDNQI